MGPKSEFSLPPPRARKPASERDQAQRRLFLTRFHLIVAVAVYVLKALFLQLADTKRRLIARLGSGKIRLCPIELV
jgi:hypothetical protein